MTDHDTLELLLAAAAVVLTLLGGVATILWRLASIDTKVETLVQGKAEKCVLHTARIEAHGRILDDHETRLKTVEGRLVVPPSRRDG